MNNLESIFKKHVGVIKEATSEAKMTSFLDNGKIDAEVTEDVPTDPAIETTPDNVAMEDDIMMGAEFAPPVAPQDMIDVNISETQKSLNLLNLFLDLKRNVEQTRDLYHDCDFSDIDDNERRSVMETKSEIDNLYNKCVTFVTENFQYESYEKCLYVYVLLRNELTAILRTLNKDVLIKKSD